MRMLLHVIKRKVVSGKEFFLIKLHDGRYAFARLFPLVVYRIYPCYRIIVFGKLARRTDGKIIYKAYTVHFI